MRKMNKVKCPKCGKDLVETIYGMPSPEIMKQYEKGEVLLGGCEIIEGVEQVKYTCFNCGTEFSKDLKELGPIFIPDELNIESEE